MCFYFRCKKVRDSDPKDPQRERIVHLIDDFRVSGMNGERILYCKICLTLHMKSHHVLKNETITLIAPQMFAWFWKCWATKC